MRILMTFGFCVFTCFGSTASAAAERTACEAALSLSLVQHFLREVIKIPRENIDGAKAYVGEFTRAFFTRRPTFGRGVMVFGKGLDPLVFEITDDGLKTFDLGFNERVVFFEDGFEDGRVGRSDQGKWDWFSMPEGEPLR